MSDKTTKIDYREALSIFGKVMIRSAILPFIVIVAVILLLPDNSFDVPEVTQETCTTVSESSIVNGFVRRWDGTCYGWTNALANRHMVADFITFILYSMMSQFLLFMHPILSDRLSSRITILFMAGFVMLCGVVHLLEGISVVYPLYYKMAMLKDISNSVSTVAAVYIGWGLSISYVRHHGRHIDNK